MELTFDRLTGAFLAKISEYDFIQLEESERTEIVDGYIFSAVAAFKKNCKYDLTSSQNRLTRSFDIDIAKEDMDELVDILSEGMLVQWMKPYLYKQDNLESLLNTKDFTGYSPAELLLRIGNAYAKVQKDYTQMIREYSYNHGDLTRLHL